MRKIMETITRRVRRISAFWDGGRWDLDQVMRLKMKREAAKQKRMGWIVNV